MEITKKHYTQMSPSDFRYIRAKVRNVNHMLNMGLDLRLSKHTYDKIANGNATNVNKNIVRRLLKDYSIIEYKLILNGTYVDGDINKEDVIDERVVLRSNFSIDKDYQVVIVYSFTNNSVVTSWKNHRLDNHKGVDLSKYDLMQVGIL